MPSSLLFAINSEGRVFGLSTNGTKWREFIYLGLEFKRLSAVPNFLWAVGGDRQIYVHAHGLDVPIRVKEEAFENERWTPFDGFSKRLLPTDRYNFSNHDGTVDRSLSKIRLPSMAWQWEGDWKLELTLDGQPLDHDGWTYAVDFPATYYSTKQWTSCVRRRKWIRYRKYIALNSWCAVAPLHKDPTKEPFIDVAVGGNLLPGSEDGAVSVWAVTACGRVMFRTNVAGVCPEGKRWSSVTVPPGCEVTQIAVGSAGLVWAVLWNGKALARTGITRDCLSGRGWLEIEAPAKNSMLQQVSIGYHGLWAVTSDSRVWFRKGVNGESSGVCDTLAQGTGWVEMCGRMAHISVAPNDQVWAVGAEDKLLYMRTSVTREDLMGKRWRTLGAPTQLSRTSSAASLAVESGAGTEKRAQVYLQNRRHRSWASLNRHTGSHENQQTRESELLDLNETCRSAPAIATRGPWRKAQASTSDSDCHLAESGSGSSAPSMSYASEGSLPADVEESSTNLVEIEEHSVGDRGGWSCGRLADEREPPSGVYENVSHPVCAFYNKGDVAMPTRSWSPQHAGGTVIATEAHNAADSIVFESDEQVGVYSEHGEREDEDDHLYWADSEAFWSIVEAGACLVNANHLPNWFSDSGSRERNVAELIEPWRTRILNELKNRTTLEDIEKYEKAVDSSGWVRSGHCKWSLPTEAAFKDCLLELEWMSGEGGEGGEAEDRFECGILTLSSPNKEESWARINVRDVTAIMSCGAPRSLRLAVYSVTDRRPWKLQFATENEFEEWKSELSSVCCRARSASSSSDPGSPCVWVTSVSGDIFACDLSRLEAEQRSSSLDGAHSLERTFTGRDTPIEVPLQSGFTPGASLTVWGCIRDEATRFAVDLTCKEESGNTHVAYHFNPRFDENRVVLNSRDDLGWGLEERMMMPFKRGSLFELTFRCTNDCFVAVVNGVIFAEFAVRRKRSNENKLDYLYVTHALCSGDVCIDKIKYSSSEIILDPRFMFWRQIEGHLRKVETSQGVTWGIGFDNTAWLYLGGHFPAPACNRRIHDTRSYYVYENQRWNPLTGYTAHGLPTDRFMWSDVTGKHKRTRETTELLSRKWRWVNDWAVDFHTPGGVDSEGWQYAMDFPSSYHGSKTLTDYVRRRRWFRRAKLESSGPWTELGYTALADCSLYAAGDSIMAWAVAANGSVLFRKGVTKECPGGISWEHVATDEKIVSISCGPRQVWAVGKSGAALCRIGITDREPMGVAWEVIEAPAGTSLEQITAGPTGIWALDSSGRIAVRGDVSAGFPLGSHWRFIASSSLYRDRDKEGERTQSTFPTGFRHISAKSKLWAVTGSGRLAYRLGVKSETSTGLLWLFGIEANFLHVSG